MRTKQYWTTEREKHLKAARDLAEKAVAEGRNFTQPERAAVEAHRQQAKNAHLEIKALEGDEDMLRHLNAIGGPTAPKGRRGPRDGSWAKSMTTYLERVGAKALTTSGAITVPALSTGIVTNLDRPRSILNLIDFIPLEGGDQFAYLREVARVQNASTVATGKKKPESNYELTKIEDRAHTIAHTALTDRSLVMDVDLLQQYLEDALREGVELELEDQVLNGDGSTAGVLDNLTGILETSGTQAQAFDTNRVVTARKAVTKLENVANGNLDPGRFAWVMTPADWEAYELMTDDNGEYLLQAPGAMADRGNLPVDRAARRLWGYPVVTSLAMTTGAPLLGDWSPQSIDIREREAVTVEFATTGYAEDVYGEGLHGDLFQANKVRFRAEGRWGLEVKRPAAYILLDVTP